MTTRTRSLELVETKTLDNGLGYVFRTEEGLPVLTTSVGFDDKDEGKNKWKIGVSLSAGCKVGCIYCFTNALAGYRKLTVDEILEQVDFVYSQPGWNQSDFDETKIEMKEMGDPSQNPYNTCGAIEALESQYSGLMYVVSTAGVKGEELFEELQRVRDNGANIRLQFSVHTTNNEQKRFLSPKLEMMRLEDIAKQVDKWYTSSDDNKRVTLTFVPIQGFELSYERIVELFSPEQILVKISYLDDNPYVRKANLNNMQHTSIDEFVDGLRTNGFQCVYRNGY